MKLLPISLVFVLSTALAAAAGLPTQFHQVPLGNVVRILSARYHGPVSIAANATAPISGDFSKLDFAHAMAEVAKQAGLVARPLGTDPHSGFALELPGAVSKAEGAPDPAVVKQALEAASRQREELLRKRQALLKEAGDSQAGS